MRFFLCFSYDGTLFHGSQIQQNAITVQQVLEERLTTLFRQPVLLTLAGRTDAGVHAEQMWAHFELQCKTNNISNNGKKLAYRLNAFMPHNIVILHLFIVNNDAHARFNALTRTYQYRIIAEKMPFTHNNILIFPYKLNFHQLCIATQLLVGTHDFANLSKKNIDTKGTICSIKQACWKYAHMPDGSPILVFQIEANRFLWNMVRMIVAMLLDVGTEKISPTLFSQILFREKESSTKHRISAKGLFLTNITYPESLFVKQIF